MSVFLPCACKREIPGEVLAKSIVNGGLRCTQCACRYSSNALARLLKDDDDFQVWFDAFDTANPAVYQSFKKMAEDLRAQGLPRYGAKTIIERLRWETQVFHKDGGGFKLDNVLKDRCSARYVRKLLAEDPTFSTFFEIRRLTTSDERKKLGDAHRRPKTVADWAAYTDDADEVDDL